jgi:hypothetical protein
MRAERTDPGALVFPSPVTEEAPSDTRATLNELQVRAEIDERVTPTSSVTRTRASCARRRTGRGDLGRILRCVPEVRYPRHGRGSGASPLHPSLPDVTNAGSA